MRVLLGPAHELHLGVHGSLLGAPPPGVEYAQSTYLLRFHHDRRPDVPFSPLHDPAITESVRFIDVPVDTDLIHSARLPVDNPLPWVVDGDSLLAPLQVGRFLALGWAARGQAPPEDSTAVRRREAAMVARYRSPRCARILLRTGRALQELVQHLTVRGFDPRTIDELVAKTDIVYPAVPPITASPRPGPVTVLFMGRTPQDKGAAAAVEVFARLRESCADAFRAVFVGPCPAELAGRLAAAGVRVVPLMTREAYLDLLAAADIFFSPTEYESVGMGLLEAAAAGTAIVCSCGPGMEHIRELLTDGENALFVPNTLPLAARTAAYAEALAWLVRDEAKRRALAANNRTVTTTGRLSLCRRDELLLAAYARAVADGPSEYARAVAHGPSEYARAVAHGQGEYARAVAHGPGEGEDGPPGLAVTEWPEQLCHWSGRRYVERIGGRVSF